MTVRESSPLQGRVVNRHRLSMFLMVFLWSGLLMLSGESFLHAEYANEEWGQASAIA
jgi:hypothetical protein